MAWVIKSIISSDNISNMRRIALLIMFTFAALSISAYDFVVNGIYYNILSSEDNTIEVTENPKGYEGEIIIPESVDYNGEMYNVIAIGEGAFCSTNLTSITIPRSIVTIGEQAFMSSKLFSATFQNCAATIGRYAFNSCPNLNDVNLGEYVTSIGYCSFYGCKNLTSITIPNSVITIGSGAFHHCENLIYVHLGESLSIIDKWAFADCKSLNKISIPPSVTSVEDGAFMDCSSLESISIGNGVKSIGDKAFQNCKFISVIVPNSVTSIGKWAFDNCGLMSVSLGNSVATIGEEAFYGNKLHSVISYNDSPPYCAGHNTGAFDSKAYETAILYVPSKALNAYSSKKCWSRFEYVDYIDVIGVNNLKGDINSDGLVNSIDVECISNYILGISSDTFNVESADLNSDGLVDVTDIVLLINVLKSINSGSNEANNGDEETITNDDTFSSNFTIVYTNPTDYTNTYTYSSEYEIQSLTPSFDNDDGVVRTSGSYFKLWFRFGPVHIIFPKNKYDKYLDASYFTLDFSNFGEDYIKFEYNDSYGDIWSGEYESGNAKVVQNDGEFITISFKHYKVCGNNRGKQVHFVFNGTLPFKISK